MKKLFSIVCILAFVSLLFMAWFYILWKPASNTTDKIAAFTALFSALAFVGVLTTAIIQIFNQQASLEMALKTARLQFLIAAFEFTGPRLEQVSKELLPLLNRDIKLLGPYEIEELDRKKGEYKYLQAEYERIHAEIHFMTESIISDKIKQMAAADTASIHNHAYEYIDKYLKQRV